MLFEIKREWKKKKKNYEDKKVLYYSENKGIEMERVDRVYYLWDEFKVKKFI